MTTVNTGTAVIAVNVVNIVNVVNRKSRRHGYRLDTRHSRYLMDEVRYTRMGARPFQRCKYLLIAPSSLLTPSAITSGALRVKFTRMAE